MNRILLSFAAGAALLLGAAGTSSAATITFAGFTGGQSFNFDGDGDGTADALFTTSDPLGFNPFGPGIGQQFIDEPGLEGTTLIDPDLRVDFLVGATGELSFGFAMNATANGTGTFVTFRAYDAANALLAETTVEALQPGGSIFVGGQVSLGLPSTAAYATFDFQGAQRYIIDNFSGTFGNTEPPAPPGGGAVPEPASLALAALGASACLARKGARARS